MLSGGRNEHPLTNYGAATAYRPQKSVAAVDYRYELRRGDEIVATGHLIREQPLEVGDPIEVGGQRGIVHTIEPLLGEREVRLVAVLARESG